MNDIRTLVDQVDYAGISKMLTAHPELANQGFSLGDNDDRLAHPLHRICDGVFVKKFSDDEGVKMATIFLEHGAKVDGDGFELAKDTPLVAAASLHAEKVAILYIDRGANIFHAGCSGGTALHWAAWCGRDAVVDRLIKAGAEIDRLCIDYKSTPLFWAIHGWNFGGAENRHHQLACARLLLAAGADKDIPNANGNRVMDMLTEAERTTLFG